MSPCVSLTLAGIVLDRPATHSQVQAACGRDVAEDNVGGESVAGLERGHCDERLGLWNFGLYILIKERCSFGVKRMGKTSRWLC